MTFSKRIFVLFITFLVLSITFASTVKAKDLPNVQVFRLTFSSSREDWPIIHKHSVYWIDAQGGISGYDLKQRSALSLFPGTPPLTNLYGLVGFDGRYLVYDSYDGTSYNVRYYDLKRNKDESITEGVGSRLASDLDEGRVAYIDGYATGNLNVYDIDTKKTISVAQNASVPRISGEYLTWYTSTTTLPYDIRVFDLIKHRLIDIPNPEDAVRSSPDINGHDLVYLYSKNGVSSVRTYDLTKKKQRILVETSSYTMSWPSISDDYVIYGKSTAPNIAGVEAVDLKTGAVFEIQPQGSFQNANLSPYISNNIAAWFDWRTGNGDIYAAMINK
jgi:hypothetical protein